MEGRRKSGQMVPQMVTGWGHDRTKVSGGNREVGGERGGGEARGAYRARLTLCVLILIGEGGPSEGKPDNC